MPLLLVFATPQECCAALPNLKSCPPEHTLVSYTLDQHEALVCLTGVGPVNAGIALGKSLAQRDDIHTVWNLGLAGSFDMSIAPLASVWRIAEEIYPEYGLVDHHPHNPHSRGADAHALGFAQYTPVPVWDRLFLPQQPTECTLPTTRALTVAGVTNSLARAKALYAQYGALLENMEGFAVALACLRAHVTCLEARVVSNRVGSRTPEDRAFARALDRLPHVLNTLILSL